MRRFLLSSSRRWVIIKPDGFWNRTKRKTSKITEMVVAARSVFAPKRGWAAREGTCDVHGKRLNPVHEHFLNTLGMLVRDQFPLSTNAESLGKWTGNDIGVVSSRDLSSD